MPSARIVVGRPYFALSEEALAWLGRRKQREVTEEEIARHDPDLIECIETLGDEAEDDFATLRVVIIYDEYYSIQEGEWGEEIETKSAIKWRRAVLE